jgi:protein dithiol oxidoreductase (disulfide-forming)
MPGGRAAWRAAWAERSTPVNCPANSIDWSRRVSKAKTDRRVTQVRNAAIAVVVLIVVLVGGYGLFFSTTVDMSGDLVEGTHYYVIDGATPIPASGPIRVTELFSYGCVHCRNFDPIVADWLEHVPRGVVFERIPVTFSPAWTLLAQTYFALLSVGALDQNHQRLFAAIHDNAKQFDSPAAMADFVDGHGVSKADFLRAYNSPEVRRALADAVARERASHASGVPSLMVGDYYMVDMRSVPRKRAFDVVDFLVAKINNERAAS